MMMAEKKENRPMNPVELEIARAEIAFLKQQEIDNGDRKKWEDSQTQFSLYSNSGGRTGAGGGGAMGGSIVYVGGVAIASGGGSGGAGSTDSRYYAGGRSNMPLRREFQYSPPVAPATFLPPITREMFVAATGYEPHNDDLERCNCQMRGQAGHWGCGWCARCNLPIFICGH